MHDGESPSQISEAAKQQVLKYNTVRFHNGLATRAAGKDNDFTLETEAGESFHTRKLLFGCCILQQLPPPADQKEMLSNHNNECVPF